jgi:hypothetical protein
MGLVRQMTAMGVAFNVIGARQLDGRADAHLSDVDAETVVRGLTAGALKDA